MSSYHQWFQHPGHGSVAAEENRNTNFGPFATFALFSFKRKDSVRSNLIR